MPYGVLPIRGGITELINDVLAGPGSGVQAALVVGLQGFPVAPTAPALGEVLTWTGAAWTPAPGGGGAVDFRAAPKYVVGNVPAGDSAVAYAADGFFYYPDPGDGSAIAAALAAAAILPGDVHVRPGSYDFNGGGSPATPLSVPQGVVVSGAGSLATTLVARSTGDQGVFVVGGKSEICDMQIVAANAVNAGTGSAALIRVTSGGASIRNVDFDVSTGNGSTLRAAILFATNSNEPCVVDQGAITVRTRTVDFSTAGITIQSGKVQARAVTITGGDIGIRCPSNANVRSLHAQDCIIYDVPTCIRLEDRARDCVIYGCDLGRNTANYGVFAQASDVSIDRIHVEHNTIRVSDYDGTGSCAGVVFGGTVTPTVRESAVSDNSIVQSGGGFAAYSAIDFSTVNDATISGNTIVTSGGKTGIDADANSLRIAVTGNTIRAASGTVISGIRFSGCSGSTITSNVVEMPSNPGSFAPIALVVGNQNTVVGNRVRSSANMPAISIATDENAVGSNTCFLGNLPGVSAIELTATADNNTVIGNVCRTVPAVNNLGTGNEVAHNI